MNNVGNKCTLPADYIGIYVTRVAPIKRQIVMADSARFAGTSSEIAFEKIGNCVKLSFSGLFQERPITMTTAHIRTDIYLNLKHCKRVANFIESLFKIKLLNKDELPRAPDPRTFIYGLTNIPKKEIPATVFFANSCSIYTPRWNIERESVKVYLDVEDDKQFNREQLHLGVTGFCLNDLTCIWAGKVRLRDIVNCGGCFSMTPTSLQVLYSHMVHYVVS